MAERSKKTRFSSDDPDENRATLFEHIDELRDRIIKVVLALAVFWIAGWFAEPYFYTFIQDRVVANLHIPGHHFDYKEVFRNAIDPFMLKFKLSFLIAMIFATPYAVLHLWGFVKPGLKPNERKPVRIAAPFSVGLFALGAALGWGILPNVIRWFVSYMDDFQGSGLYQEPGLMVFFTLKMILAFGVGFQLPLVVYILVRIGVLTPEALYRNWRQWMVGIFFAATVFTPSNDAISMLTMAIPVTLLFVLTVWVVKLTTPKRVAQEVDE